MRLLKCLRCDSDISSRRPNARYCDTCNAEKKREQQRAAFYGLRASGTCVECRRRPVKDMALRCGPCRDQHNRRARKRRRELVKEGRCKTCLKPSDGGPNCSECKARDAARKRGVTV